jgi:hypothetical protein
MAWASAESSAAGGEEGLVGVTSYIVGVNGEKLKSASMLAAWAA